MSLIKKNRNRDKYSFANINLLGKCNVDCYFCLGKDIEEYLTKHNQLCTHFNKWNRFEEFLKRCKNNDIKKLYITGQNTDSLMYKYLSELIDYLHGENFKVGLRTNGFLALNKEKEILKCDNNVGYSIHTLEPLVNKLILGKEEVPDWNSILKITENTRVSIVINRYNWKEFLDIVFYLSKFDNIKYIQARRISTDKREKELEIDIKIYEKLYSYIKSNYEQVGTFYEAQQFKIFGKEVCFWRTVETTSNSMNYFTDGTISDEYFVVEGYLKNQTPQKTIEQKISSICMKEDIYTTEYPNVETWKWWRAPQVFKYMYVGTYSFGYTPLRVMDLIKEADEVECLTSKSEYIRECKKYYMEKI